MKIVLDIDQNENNIRRIKDIIITEVQNNVINSINQNLQTSNDLVRDSNAVNLDLAAISIASDNIVKRFNEINQQIEQARIDNDNDLMQNLTNERDIINTNLQTNKVNYDTLYNNAVADNDYR